MIKRLRPVPSRETLQSMYPKPHDHRIFGRGHRERVAMMIKFAVEQRWPTAADLSCGNGAVLEAVDADQRFFGDLAPGWPIEGPIEETISGLPYIVDLLIMGETLEHLGNPEAVLQLAATTARYLLVSTPIDAWDDSNAEHLWAWDREGVEGLLTVSGWESILRFDTVDSRTWGEPYCYGVWLVGW